MKIKCNTKPMVKITNIKPRYYETQTGYKTRAAYTPAKMVDCGTHCFIYTSSIEPDKDDATNKVLTDDVVEQTKQVFREVGHILGGVGATMDDVVKAVIYLTDLDDFKKISAIRAGHFELSMPVSTLVEVRRLRAVGAKIAMEVTAVLSKV